MQTTHAQVLLTLGIFLAAAFTGLTLWHEFGLPVALLSAFLLC